MDEVNTTFSEEHQQGESSLCDDVQTGEHVDSEPMTITGVHDADEADTISMLFQQESHDGIEMNSSMIMTPQDGTLVTIKPLDDEDIGQHDTGQHHNQDDLQESGLQISEGDTEMKGVQPLLTLGTDGQYYLTTTATTDLTNIQALQAITLPDGSTAYLQTPRGGPQFQTVQLEDGTTAIVSTGNVALSNAKCEPEDNTAIQIGEGVGQLLQDGSILEGAHNMDPSEELSLEQQIAMSQSTAVPSEGQISGHNEDSESVIINMIPGSQRPPSERALALGDKAFKCKFPNCGRLYTTQHHLKVHSRSHTGDKPYKCKLCEKAFASGYGLKSHMRTHTGEKPYQCPVSGCTKAFKTSGDLQKHIRTHTGEKPFLCPFEGCDRRFTTSNIRKVHIRTHTGERPYECPEPGCTKSFSSATNYKNHIRIHSGEKPYVCSVEGCNKRFTEYSSLYKHHVVHTRSKPYVCDHCGKTYRQTSTLAMHKRTAHGDDSGVATDTSLTLIQQDINNGGSHIVQVTPAKNASTPYSVRKDKSSEGKDEGDGNLVINTDTSQAGITLLQGGSQLPLQLQAGESGLQTTEFTTAQQQIIVVTDPAQLQVLQAIAQQQQTPQLFTVQAPLGDGTENENGTTETASNNVNAALATDNENGSTQLVNTVNGPTSLENETPGITVIDAQTGATITNSANMKHRMVTVETGSDSLVPDGAGDNVAGSEVSMHTEEDSVTADLTNVMANGDIDDPPSILTL